MALDREYIHQSPFLATVQSCLNIAMVDGCEVVVRYNQLRVCPNSLASIDGQFRYIGLPGNENELPYLGERRDP